MRRAPATLLAAAVSLLAVLPFAAMFAPWPTAAALFGSVALGGAVIGPWLFANARRAVIMTAATMLAGSMLMMVGDPPVTLAGAAAAPVRLLVDSWWDLLTVPLPVPAEPVLLALPLLLTFLAAGLAAHGMQRGRLALLAGPLLALWLAGLVLGLGPVAPLWVVAPFLLGLGGAAVLLRAGGTGAGAGRALAGAAVLTVAAAAAVPLAAATAAGASDPVDPRAHISPPIEPVALVNPLDTLIGQIGSGDEQPVFTALSDVAPATPFWTVATLDVFDGRSWQPGHALAPAIGPVSGEAEGPAPASVAARQQLTVGDPLAPWVPHLGVVTHIDSRGLLHSRGADLLVDASALASAGPALRTYRVESAWPAPEVSALGAAGVAQVPAGSPLLDSSCLPAAAVAGVEDAASGATSAFDRAAAVVRWMRQSSGLQPSREALSGHSCAALTDSLEQAAETGTIGASADQLATVQTLALRSQGIPARLAVGYAVTPAGEDGRYTVQASQATAWSQIHLDGIGWIDIAAEPPGLPGDAHGVAGTVSAAGILEAAATAPPAAAKPQPDAPPVPEPAAPGGPAGSPAAPQWPLAVVLLLMVLPLLALVVARVRVRLLRRRRSSGDPRAQVLGAWAEVRDALAGCGVATAGRTALQTAQDLPPQSPARSSVEHLAGLVQRAAYDPRPVSPDTARQAWELAAEARRALVHSRRGRQRVPGSRWPVRAASAGAP